MNKKGFSEIWILAIAAVVLAVGAPVVFLNLRLAKHSVNPDVARSQPAPTPQPKLPPPMTAPPPPGPSIEGGRKLLGQCGDAVTSSTAESFDAGWVNQNGWDKNFYVQSSSASNWNYAVVPMIEYRFSGYCFLYPKAWEARIVGADEMNIALSDGTISDPNGDWDISSESGRSLLMLIGESDSPPTSAPVASGETILSEQKMTFNGTQGIHVTSKAGGLTYNRYFIWHAGANYMFQSRVPDKLADSATYANFTSVVKQVVSSMRFVR